jgi:hypothetical protein
VIAALHGQTHHDARVLAHRDRVAERHGLHAWQGSHSAGDLVEEGGGPRGCRLVARPLQVESHRDHPLGAETGVEREQAREAPDEQACASQKHDGHGDLDHDERATQPRPAGAAGRQARRLLQRRVHIHARGHERRANTE